MPERSKRVCKAMCIAGVGCRNILCCFPFLSLNFFPLFFFLTYMNPNDDETFMVINYLTFFV